MCLSFSFGLRFVHALIICPRLFPLGSVVSRFVRVSGCLLGLSRFEYVFCCALVLPVRMSIVDGSVYCPRFIGEQVFHC